MACIGDRTFAPCPITHCEEKGDSSLLRHLVTAGLIRSLPKGTAILRAFALRYQQVAQNINCTNQPVCGGNPGIPEQTSLPNLTSDFLHFPVDHSFVMPGIKIVHGNSPF
jgi:hypothetical protein